MLKKIVLGIFLCFISTPVFAVDSASFNPNTVAVTAESSGTVIACNWSGWRLVSAVCRQGYDTVPNVVANQYCVGNKIAIIENQTINTCVAEERNGV